jgi:hypothetical protein
LDSINGGVFLDWLSDYLKMDPGVGYRIGGGNYSKSHPLAGFVISGFEAKGI